MSAPQLRWSVIGVWLTICCIGFSTVDSMTARSWLLLIVSGIIPPLMLLWLWNEDRPVLMGSLRPGHRRL